MDTIFTLVELFEQVSLPGGVCGIGLFGMGSCSCL